MLNGQCLCGHVRYEISAPVRVIRHCHCANCRKFHAAAFGSYAGIESGTFGWTQGSEYIRRYESSPGNARLFCSTCGSKLGTELEGAMFGVTLGTLDSVVTCANAMHIFTAGCAGWFHPSDNLATWPGYPPAESGRID